MSEANTSSLRVLIADDHAVVRQGLKHILSKTADLLVVDEAETGLKFWRKFETLTSMSWSWMWKCHRKTGGRCYLN